MVLEKIISSGKNTVDSLEEVFAVDIESRKLAEQLIDTKIKKVA